MSGDVERALQELEATKSISDEFGLHGADFRDVALARAEVLWLTGDDNGAERVLRQARSELQLIDDSAWVATQSAPLAELLADGKRHAEALAFAEESARKLVVRGDLRTEAAWRRARAIAGAADAEDLARKAIALLETTDEANEQAKAHLSLAQVLGAGGREDEAAAATVCATDLLRRKGNVSLLARIAPLDG